MTKSKINNRAKILVCGSSHFTDKNFVFGTLSMLNEMLQQHHNTSIGEIHTSNFSGSCKFAASWVEIHNEGVEPSKCISLKDCTFDMHLDTQNHSFFGEADIPEPILKEDPFFKKGQEQLQKAHINTVIAFPNENGDMGASTMNILRFAKLAKISPLDCSTLYKQLMAHQRTASIQNEIVEPSAYSAAIINRRSSIR